MESLELRLFIFLFKLELILMKVKILNDFFSFWRDLFSSRFYFKTPPKVFLHIEKKTWQNLRKITKIELTASIAKGFIHFA